MSSSPFRFPRDLIDALAAKRAFPLLIEHREPSVPGLSMTAVAHVDLGITYLVITKDGEEADEWVTIPVEPFLVEPTFPVESECEDATIVHELWSEWHSGGLKNAIDVLKNLGPMVRRQEMRRMIARERIESRKKSREPNETPQTSSAPKQPRRKPKGDKT